MRRVNCSFSKFGNFLIFIILIILIIVTFVKFVKFFVDLDPTYGLIFATLILAFIAWTQLQALQKTSGYL